MELPDSVFFVLKDMAPMTRVTYAADGMHAEFEKEDLVGCFALNDDLTATEGFKANACYRVAVHTNITTGEDREFLAPVTDADDLPRTAAKYLFYYPYDPAVTSLDDLQSYSHSVLADQNDRNRFEASDLLWDICAPISDEKYVEIYMDHAMAQIIVEIESDLIAEGTVPTLLGIPATVSSLNLVKSSLEEMTADMGESYVLGGEDSDIIMWEFGYATSGSLMFRAVVPANHTKSSGSKIIMLTDPEGNTKQYRLSKALDFKPGMNYQLTLVSEREFVSPDDVDDDDTWVYDVLDPETMEPVGMLCKEYLRFQPEKGLTDPDVSTGVDYTKDGEQTKYISSQAWVFYKLNEGVPDLNTGYVLRFISDMRTSQTDSRNSACWPEPHINRWYGGLFMADHGHLWGDNGTNGVSATEGEEYGMHGGVLTWDGVNNKISWFSLPSESVKGDYETITNEIAATQGHIAISNDGDPYLCYTPLTDATTYKVGLLSPYYLVDRRVGKDGDSENRTYPLVKIGYNQFWMSLSLRASTQIDGTPLTNYNMIGGPGVSIPAVDVKPGYMFAYKQLASQETIDGKTYTHYDPYNDMTLAIREKYKISGMYNFLAITEGAGMLPRSTYANSEYYIPMLQDICVMHNYLGWKSAAKLITRRIRTYNSETFIENEYEALRNGKYTSSTLGNYSSNICGFDLRAEGYYYYNGMEQVGCHARMLLLGENETNPNSLYVFSLPDYDVFKENFISDLNNPDNAQIRIKINGDGSGCFAPLRFFMKFNGQADTEGGASVSSTASGLNTKSSSFHVKNRDIYVGLEPVEE